MTSELELIKKIEAYLNGEMSEDDMRKFEEERGANAALDQKVVEHVEFLKSIKSYGEVKALKSTLNTIHDEVDIDAVTFVERRTKVIALWDKYKRSLAVAASAAIITTVFTLFSTGQLKKSQTENTYSALKRDMETIKKSHNALVRNVNSKAASANKASAASQVGGTGFALTGNGYILTNYHVVQGADSIHVQNHKGESFKTQTIYVDPVYDIAVLFIDDPAFNSTGALPYTFKKLAADLGEDVYTIGYPRDEVVLGRGYLSAQTGFGGDTMQYQVSIPVNPGNSGGPLLDNRGNVIGIISGKQNQTDGAAFAIKSDYVLKAIENITQDSLKAKISLNKKNNLASLNKTQQIKKMQDYIYMVKVYN